MNLKNLLWISASLLLTNTDFAGPAGAIQYPDLVTLDPTDIGIEYDSSTGKKLIRFSNSIANLGDGPLEVMPVNNAAYGTTDAYQRLYSRDTNGNWNVASTNYVGTFAFHPAHNHWHFGNFARYELHNVAADGSVGANVFAFADKVSFCLIDDRPFSPGLTHSFTQVYNNCNQVDPQGISAGAVDLYPWTLPDQDLDITGLPDGDYWLVSTVDPSNLVNEGGGPAENNNTAAVKVHIGSEIVWMDDAVPEGADTGASGGDSWKWISSDPTPFSGNLAHQSALKAGMHQHFFSGASANLAVSTNNTLFTHVYLDPVNPPTELMLQWADPTNSEHRAYWGANSIALGTNGTPSRHFVGPLPPAGKWVRLEVPANAVDLEGHTLTGMYFTLYGGRATWDYAGVQVAPPFVGAAPAPISTSAVPPILSSFTTSPFGISIGLTDGTTQVKLDSIKLTFDGSALLPAVSKAGAVTTVKYDARTFLTPGSTHTVKLELADTAISSVTRSYGLNFAAPDYALVPTEFASAPDSVDKTKPGFRIRPYETEANNPNNLAWTEDQFAGLKGPNLANLSGADANGYYARETVIHFDIGGGAGNFPDDEPFPGLPGNGPRDGGTGNSAMEVLTFLEFPNPGLYIMGVNSDDGFRVTTGANALDKFSVKLGEFDGVRGASDTLFRILVSQAGVYPFRLIWENGGGSANLEWFTVNNGVKVLINDPNTPGSIKAYREGSTRAYVKAVSPPPDAVDVPSTNNISITLADATVQVQVDSIQLFLNGQPVVPTINKAGGLTTVTYTAQPKLAAEAKNTIRFIYADNASPPNVRTQEFSFVVAPDFDVLVGLSPTQQWRYNESGSDPGAAWKEVNFDDSSWPSGSPLFEGKKGTVPDLPEPVRTTLTIGSSITTYYFRTHFNFPGNPGAARLRLRAIIDDGAIFYLNGTEIYRQGMPGGPVAASTLAARTVGDAVYEGPFDVAARALVSGDNVLAVEVHQVSATSSDITMGVQLIWITSNPVRTALDSINPAPGAMDVPRDTAIEITLRDGAQKVQPESIQLFVNGQLVTASVSKPAGSASTKVSYRPDQLLPPQTKVSVKLVFSDDATPLDVTTKEFSFTTQPDATFLIAIDDKQMWRYDESGKDLGTAWREKGFDDSAWKSGAALFEGKKGTVPALPERVRTSLTIDSSKTNFYFRTHFNFTGDPAAAQLKIKPIIDDGAVIYLNGLEIYRIGMPAGRITASTFASRTVGDAAYEGPFDVPATGSVAGDNLLAVEVHQASATSSDITMGLQLLLAGSGAPPPPATLKFASIRLVGGSLKIEWTGAGRLQSAATVTGPWTDVDNASSPFTAVLSDAAKFYRLKQ